jgi:hypothetical protein
MIDAAVHHQDFGPFEELLQVVTRPFSMSSRSSRAIRSHRGPMNGCSPLFAVLERASGS